MSLFGDLPPPKNSSAAGISTVKTKKPLFAPPSSVLRAAALANSEKSKVIKPVANALSSYKAKNSTTASAVVNDGEKDTLAQPLITISSVPNGPLSTVSSSSIFLNADGDSIKDEYDPNQPNDYEAIVRERDRRREEMEARERQLAVERDRRRADEEERKRAEAKAAAAAAVMASSSSCSMVVTQAALDDFEAKRALLGITGEDAYHRRLTLSFSSSSSS
eukprot:CAMPEP_0175056646 /NCGR_PEP_ID=MMETSP0052_2-20121109/10798_1 /TAXON_ID=51329 ORGANISM="Polytomella parva, Strain SAG 63-3" /NCGR_SAMPLE_ID=MMETSP0052_2 /ASSEMBLY_ACC=CAM_ASM_000194 /LENGTH=219 /DNA_ID=CAMNT_0016321719 /DNA_START=166 /DNA_END=822 /DNA_ORIENTATION=+